MPELKGRKAAEPPTSVHKECGVPSVENSIRPAFEDCIPPDVDYPAPPVIDSAPAESEDFPLPGFEDAEDAKDKDCAVKDNAYHASSRCKASWKCSERSNPTMYASIRTGYAEDKPGDLELSSYYQICQETC